ncbi:hypothetical protein ACTU45_27155 [Streptomyces sp. 24-1644]|uniref:hypothetical protein n=1 Tax=Streptomyces sp. 24-1644 TaxID=3457315 RepID=UPI003FA6A336
MIALSVHDGPSSQVTVGLPLFPRTGRIDDQFGKVLGVCRKIQLVEEGQRGSRFQAAVDVVETRPKTPEDG